MPPREEMHNLAQGIIGAFEARTAGITYLRGEVVEHRHAAQAHLRVMDRNHQAIARRQRGELARGRAALHREVGGYRRGTQVHLREVEATVREYRQATQTQLHELDQAHQSMSRQQRVDLANGRTALHQATQSQLQGHRDELAGYRDEQAGARDEWRQLGAVMQAKRNGVAVGNASHRSGGANRGRGRRHS